MRTLVSTAGAASADPIEVSDLLQPGVKAGPWIVERELGRGGMGVAYAVVHDAIGKRAAMKVVHGRLPLHPDRMLLEARVVNQIGHPNIVDIFDTGRLADGRSYIVMERLDGQPLAHRAGAGRLLADQVIAILLQVCDALIAAHAAGIVHRDLKSENVFLVDNPGDPATPKVKLLDWGIAKVINQDVHHTVEGQLVGTPHYLAPEQARGAMVSAQTDVYSLGVMAYELFLEQLPFEAETAAEVMVMHLRAAPPPPHELWPEIPAPLEQLLLAMLAKDPHDRPTMTEVARRLELALGEIDRRRDPIDPKAAPVEPLARSPRIGVARQTATARWRFVVGAMAIAASAATYITGRTSDTTAATTPEAGELHGDRAPRSAAAPTRRAAPIAVVPAIQVAAPTAVRRFAAAPIAVATARQVAAPPARRAPAIRRSSHAAPAAPRRATRIDPDGTIDPYR